MFSNDDFGKLDFPHVIGQGFGCKFAGIDVHVLVVFLLMGQVESVTLWTLYWG